jgi:hypothetical protein
MKTSAVGNVRVSTDQQAEHGVSLEAQVEKIGAMATVDEVELLDVIVDAGESAKDLDRPGMTRVLDLVQSRAVGMVIIAKLDRLTRSVATWQSFWSGSDSRSACGGFRRGWRPPTRPGSPIRAASPPASPGLYYVLFPPVGRSHATASARDK